MMYVRFPLSLGNVEDLLHERSIDISHKTVRYWWNRFGPIFAAEMRQKRVQRMQCWQQWQWHLDEVFIRINDQTHYLWRAVDHEGEVLEALGSKRRDRKAALKFLRKATKRYVNPKAIVTDRLRSYRAAMKVIGNADSQKTGRWPNNRAENSHQPFRRREQAMTKLRSTMSLQKFGALHGSIYNHFTQERHLDSRKNFKITSIALAEWQRIAT
jgi:putative transposase